MRSPHVLELEGRRPISLGQFHKLKKHRFMVLSFPSPIEKARGGPIYVIDRPKAEKKKKSRGL